MTKELKSKNRTDMINGSLWDKIILFALPLAATSILQQLFNAADTAVVGKFAGSEALAAVGSNTVTVGLAVNILVGFSIGPNVVMARLIGEGRSGESPRVIRSAAFLSVVMGLFFMIAGLITAEPFLRVLGTPDHIITLAVLYFRIYLIGVPFMALYNFMAAIFRSRGETSKPLVCLIISGSSNVLLNLLFVIGLKMSVAGVALATVISNILGLIIILRMLLKNEDLKLGPEFFTPDRYYLKQLFNQGAPAAMQSGVFSISNLFVQAGINSFGEAAIAGSSAALNAEFFAFGLSSAFAAASVTFTGQNYGAGKRDRCRKVFSVAELECLITSGLLCLGFFLFRYQFASAFSSDPEVIDFAARRIVCVGAFEFMTGFYEVASGSLRGSGHPLVPSLLTLIGTVGFRIVWLYTVFTHFRTFEVLSIIYPVSWLLTTAMIFTALYLYSRKESGK